MAPARSGRAAGGIVREPVYVRLHRSLEAWIRERGLKAGDRFPSEREISERFGVSRLTANKALAHLALTGALEFRKGVGTFVRNGHLEHDLRALVSFTHLALAAGLRPTTRVLRFRRVAVSAVPPPAASTLRLGPRDSVWAMERLRLADGIPYILERRWVPRSVWPDLRRSDVRGSLYDALARRGLAPTGARQRVSAVNLDASSASLLGLAPGAAALRIEAVAESGARPLWFEITVYRGDRYEFVNPLGTLRAGGPGGLWIRGGVAGAEEAGEGP